MGHTEGGEGVSFMLRLTVAADDGSERLVSTAKDDGNHMPLQATGAAGNYRLTVRAVKCVKQQGSASVSFRMPHRQRHRGLS